MHGRCRSAHSESIKPLKGPGSKADTQGAFRPLTSQKSGLSLSRQPDNGGRVPLHRMQVAIRQPRPGRAFGVGDAAADRGKIGNALGSAATDERMHEAEPWRICQRRTGPANTGQAERVAHCDRLCVQHSAV